MSQKGDGMTSGTSRSKSAGGNLNRHPSLQTKLQDMNEVKTLHISEEKFSYYDEYKTFELGEIKTLKPQFMYDAALAMKKDEERASRERFEGIRRRFWKKWAPASDDAQKPQKAKVLGGGKSKLHPFNLDVVKASSPEKEAVLKASGATYQECVNRAARDAIVFASNVKPPTCRMKRLPGLLKTLNKRVELSETKGNNLYVQRSETSSIENVNEWVKRLNPYMDGSKIHKRISISARRARTSIPLAQIKKSRLLSAQGRRKERAAREHGRGKRHRSRRPKNKSVLGKKLLTGRKVTGVVSLPLHDNYSIISMEQLLTYATQPARADSDTTLKRKVYPAKKAQELKEDIEMVKNLPMNIFPDVAESKVSCKADPLSVDSIVSKHWQERRLYYRKQQGINYDVNYKHACLQRLCYVPPKKGGIGRHLVA